MKLIQLIGRDTLDKELLKLFECLRMLLFCLRLFSYVTKISHATYEDLFLTFLQKADTVRSYRGYRLLAVDGSALHIPTNPHDPKSLYPDANGQKPYNLLRMNILYDLISHSYQYALIQ